mmetsp:Transcript_97641/g.315248  ORF Transcript_97641/g.315248 Transcript_97641/m.315248 type:complete len:206 (-) Transcript_97641:137-754(-)
MPTNKHPERYVHDAAGQPIEPGGVEAWRAHRHSCHQVRHGPRKLQRGIAAHGLPCQAHSAADRNVGCSVVAAVPGSCPAGQRDTQVDLQPRSQSSEPALHGRHVGGGVVQGRIPEPPDLRRAARRHHHKTPHVLVPLPPAAAHLSRPILLAEVCKPRHGTMRAIAWQVAMEEEEGRGGLAGGRQVQEETKHQFLRGQLKGPLQAP